MTSSPHRLDIGPMKHLGALIGPFFFSFFKQSTFAVFGDYSLFNAVPFFRCILRLPIGKARL